MLHYKIHRISLNIVESYIDSLEWLKYMKVTITSKNKDDKCVQYAVTVALNHQNILKNPEIITKSKPFIYQYDWK